MNNYCNVAVILKACRKGATFCGLNQFPRSNVPDLFLRTFEQSWPSFCKQPAGQIDRSAGPSSVFKIGTEMEWRRAKRFPSHPLIGESANHRPEIEAQMFSSLDNCRLGFCTPLMKEEVSIGSCHEFAEIVFD